MLVNKFTNFKSSIGKIEDGTSVVFFHDDQNRCWYNISDLLDAEPNKYLIVGCQSTGWVNFIARENVRSTYAPHEGSSIYVFELGDLPDDLPINTSEYNRLKVVDDKLVRVSTRPPKVERSKESILRDLDKLREELMSIKEQS